MLNRKAIGVVAFLSLVPTASFAAGTRWQGTVILKASVFLRQPLTASQTVYCQLDLDSNDTAATVFTAHRVSAAVPRTPSTAYYCDLRLPYNWEDQTQSGQMISIRGVYSAFLYDSSLPPSSTASASTGKWLVANNIPGGTNEFTYATRISLY